MIFFPSQRNEKRKEKRGRLNMWRISEEVSWTVKSSYFEKGTVQWIACIEKKKSVCLKYANVVLLLYDALNLTDNLMVSLWWYQLLRGCSAVRQGLPLSPLRRPGAVWGGWSDRSRFLHCCLQFSDLNNSRMTTILSTIFFLLAGRWPLPWDHCVSQAEVPCLLPFLASHLFPSHSSLDL